MHYKAELTLNVKVGTKLPSMILVNLLFVPIRVDLPFTDCRSEVVCISGLPGEILQHSVYSMIQLEPLS